MIRTDSDTLHGDRPLTGIDALVRKQVLAKLGKLRHGHLQLREAGECRAYGDPAMPGFGTLTIMDGRFFGKLAFGGSVGAAESYMDGDWQSDDLVGLMRLLIRNRNLLDAMEGGGARFAGWMMQKLLIMPAVWTFTESPDMILWRCFWTRKSSFR